MLTVNDITSVIEEAAPLGLQESYDNSGLLVGSSDREVNAALLTVDMTEEVLCEAVETGCNMVISHHPVIFHPLRRLNGSNFVERVVEFAIRHDISLYACHTNLDSAANGLSRKLGSMIGLNGMEVLSPTFEGAGTGLGVIGHLSEPTAAANFLDLVKSRLQIRMIRHSRLFETPIRKVAICTGAGANLMDAALCRGVQLYLSADFRYNNFMDVADRMMIADIGHFESEYCSIEVLYEIITEKFPTFALLKSKRSENPVKYLF